MTRYLTDESQVIYDIVQKIGTLTVSQITKIDTAHSPLATVKFLYLHNYVSVLNDTYVLPFKKKKEKTSAIACFWAMLALITDEEGNVDHNSLNNIIEGNEIIDFTYLHNNSLVVNMVYLDDTYFSKVNMVKQRFYNFNAVEPGHEKDAGIIHVFVTDSPNTAVEVSKMDIKIPHKIILLEGNLASEPTVKYL